MRHRYLGFFLIACGLIAAGPACRRKPKSEPPEKSQAPAVQAKLAEPSWSWEGPLARATPVPSPEDLWVKWALKVGETVSYRLGQTTILEKKDTVGNPVSVEMEQLLEGTLSVTGADSDAVQLKMELAAKDTVQKGKRVDTSGWTPTTHTLASSNAGLIQRDRYSGDQDAAMQLLLDIVFPMPDRPLAENEFCEREVRSPYAEKDSRLKGKVSTLFRSTAVIQGRRCAVLETTIALEVVPVTGTDGSQGKWEGTGEAIYDMDLGAFLSSSVSMKILTSRQREPFAMAQTQRFVVQRSE